MEKTWWIATVIIPVLIMFVGGIFVIFAANKTANSAADLAAGQTDIKFAESIRTLEVWRDNQSGDIKALELLLSILSGDLDALTTRADLTHSDSF